MKVLNPVYSLESNWGFGTKSWSSETGSQWTVNNWWRCWKAPPCPRRRCWPYLTLLSMLLGSRFWCNIIPTTILPSQKLYFMEENINYHLTTLKWQWIKCLQNIRKEGVEWQFFPFHDYLVVLMILLCSVLSTIKLKNINDIFIVCRS